MKSIKLCLNISAVNAYIYGGYLFIFLSDGTIGYINMLRLLALATNGDEDLFPFLKISFLPHQYLRGKTFEFLNNFSTIHHSILNTYRSLFNKEHSINISQETLKSNMHIFDEFAEIPLDVRLYCGEIFLASESGLLRGHLQADKKYRINPSKLNKIFDGCVLNLSSKGGILAASADSDGLFAYNLFSQKFFSDTPTLNELSIRSEWSKSYKLINYKTNVYFDLFSSNIKQEDFSIDTPLAFREDTKTKKNITSFNNNPESLGELLTRTNIKEEDLNYTFNTSSSGFFLYKDGQLEVRNMIGSNEKNYYSSKSKFCFDAKTQLRGKKIISAVAVPSGCVFELYDKILLIKDNKIKVIGSEPAYSVRSYLSSINYQNLLSVVYDDRIEIIAMESFPNSYMEKSSSFLTGDTAVEANNDLNYETDINEPTISDPDLPF